MDDERLFAHTADFGDWEPLDEHIFSTAKTAESMALAPFVDLAYNAGLWHDVGKATAEFQAYLKGIGDRVEHAACGARQIEKRKRELFGSDIFTAIALEYVVSGHHAGLPDYGVCTDNSDMPTLVAKLKRKLPDCDRYAEKLVARTRSGSAYRDFLRGAETDDGDFETCLRERFVFSVRYLFSLLTDADFLETEAFCCGRRVPPRADFAAAEKKLAERLGRFVPDTAVKQARSRLSDAALSAVDTNSAVFSLDMPTGSGKTLTGLRLALKLLRERGLKRIIYIIPYTSILDQTAKEFERYFNEDEILVCHGNYDFDVLAGDDGDVSLVDKMKRSAENWDAPIVLSTNVQFFESVYSDRSGRLRKLHNMAESVLVFDEIHTMPVKYFQPCMTAIGQLTENYGSTAIFMTATMPDFAALCARYTNRPMRITPLINDKRDFIAFRNCDFKYIGNCDDDMLAGLASENRSSLIIVNSRKKAVEVYNAVVGNKVHLSTSMTPNDRARAFVKIRDALDSGEHITVVSTSLIEAGVDLDFDAVYRELAGLDNILQAAGRCNREGARRNCTTYIFECGETGDSELDAKRSITRRLVNEYIDKGLQNEECVRKYYDEVYEFSAARESFEKSRTDADRIIGDKPYKYNFAAYAQMFKLIEDASYDIVVPDREIADEIDILRSGGRANKRKLRKFTASATYGTAKTLWECGALERLGEYSVLCNSDYYCAEIGLTTETSGALIL